MLHSSGTHKLTVPASDWPRLRLSTTALRFFALPSAERQR